MVQTGYTSGSGVNTIQMMRWYILLLIGLCVLGCSAQQGKQSAAKNSLPKEKTVVKPGEAQQQKKLDPSTRTLKSTTDPNKPSEGTPVLVKAKKIENPIASVGKYDGKTKDPANILVVAPLPFYSHTNNFMPIFKALAQRGHNITVISPYPPKENIPNLEHIKVENVYNKIMAGLDDKDFSKQTGLINDALGMYFLGSACIHFALEFPEVQAMYKDTSRKYDLVFVEAQFIQEPMIAFGRKFGAPVISFFPTMLTPEALYYTGNPVLTSTYVPNLAYPISNRMSFMERAQNTALTVLKLLVYEFLHVPFMDKIMRKYFDDDLPYLGDMLANTSFTLIDANLALNYPYPRTNNVREYLGINAKHSSDLTPELQEFMDNANEGVVYFTLGSHYQTSTLRPQILKSLISAFSRLPQKVLMKWDGENPPPNVSDNVFTAKWFPQPGILNHRNCKAFLTHTGAHGLIEAMDHGIPVISMPLFADQKFYARWAAENDLGRVIDIDTITPENVFETITEVLNNPKYKKNAVIMSETLRDVPVSPLAEVIHWVEYVHRTKGAKNLRPGSLDLAWYQRFGVDLIAAALVMTLVPLWIVFALLKCCISRCCRSAPKKKLKKN